MRMRLVMIVMVSVAVGASLLYFLNGELYTVSRERPSQAASSRHFFALEKLLDRYDIDYQSHESWAGLPELPPSNESLIFLDYPRYSQPEDQAQTLLQWAEDGGHLFAIAHADLPHEDVDYESRRLTLPKRGDEAMDALIAEDPLLGPIGIGLNWIDHEVVNNWRINCGQTSEDSARSDEDDEACVDQYSLIYDFETRPELIAGTPYRVDPGEFHFTNTEELAFIGRAPNQIYRSGNHTLAAEFDQGRGLITALTGVNAWSNRSLRENDNAAFLLHLLLKNAQGRTIYFVHTNDIPSLWWWLWNRAYFMMLAGVLLLIAFVWRSWPRFGPVLFPTDDRQRSLEKHLEASGYFYWKTGRCQEPLEALQKDTANRLKRKWPKENSDQLDSNAAAEHLKIDSFSLTHALHRAPANSAEFTQMIHTLQLIRNSL